MTQDLPLPSRDGEVTKPARRRGRPRAEESALREEALLAVAREEFLAKGFEGANLDEIAQRCGISKMTIYRQIGSKVALFHMVTMSAVGSLRTDFQNAIDTGSGPEEVIRALIRLSKENSNADNFAILRLVISQGYNFPDFLQQILQDTMSVTKPVADYLQQFGVATTPQEAMRRALILQAMAVGGFLKLIGSDEPNERAWEDDVLHIFLHGIGPPARG